MAPREVVILGSTGSVGTQAIDIVKRNPDKFRVVGLAAGGSDPGHARSPSPRSRRRCRGGREGRGGGGPATGVLRRGTAPRLQRGEYPVPKVLAGPDAATEIATVDVTWSSTPSRGRLDFGRRLQLSGGEARARQQGVADRRWAAGRGSSAARADHPRRLGALGPRPVPARRPPGRSQPADPHRKRWAVPGPPARHARRHHSGAGADPSDLGHGPLVTVNSATLVNKGLEVIEAHLLFGIPFDAIEVIVHPQSIVHSMVEFTDGSDRSQAARGRMRP